jgi:hypothetical protein
VTPAAQAQSDQQAPLRLGEAGVPVRFPSGLTSPSTATYRVVGLERAGAVIDWMYLEDLATGAFVEQDVPGG